MSHNPYLDGYLRHNTAADDYWAKKREQEREERAKHRRAILAFMGMLSPIGRVR